MRSEGRTHWKAVVMAAMVAPLLGAAPARSDGAERERATHEEATSLQQQGEAALALRAASIASAVAVLNEGPQAHSVTELGAAVKLLGALRADTPDAVWALLNYVTYDFPPPQVPDNWAWIPLELYLEQPSAGDSLLSIGPGTVPYLVSRLAHTDDSGMRWGCLQLLGYLMGAHAIPVLESAIQQTPDPQAQARLQDIITRHRDYFVGGGCFMLPPPYRGPVPQW